MAQIGLKNIKYSVIDEDGKYTGAKVLGKAISTKVTPSVVEGKLYADDNIAESVAVVTGGTVDVTVDNITATTYAEILGHAYNETTKEVIRNGNSVAPYLGFGRIITKLVNNVLKYKVEFLSKVQFKDSLPEEKTKGESIEFGTPTLNGNFYTLPDGTWSKTAEFDDFTSAETYLNELLSAPSEE